MTDTPGARGSKLIKDRLDGATTHCMLSEALRRVESGAGGRGPVLLSGPSGSGKTHLARQLAEVLDLPFHSSECSYDAQESSLLGRARPSIATGEITYISTPFATSFIDGGVFVAEDIDQYHPAAQAILIQALVCGRITLADGRVVEKHKDFVLVMSCTRFAPEHSLVSKEEREWLLMARIGPGYPAELMHWSGGTIGVPKVTMDYDIDLERELIGEDKELFTWWRRARAAADRNNQVTTRGLERAIVHRRGGLSVERVLDKATRFWAQERREKLGITWVYDERGAGPRSGPSATVSLGREGSGSTGG